MDSDLDDDLDETGEPLAKREKAESEMEPEVIQVLQVGTMEDGSSAVVGMLSSLPAPGGGGGATTATIIPAEHAEHILPPPPPPGATSTIRHCNSAGNSFTPV